MEKEHYILKYTHPYLLSNRTCSKYFVISNAAIDSLLLGLSDLSQLSSRQVLSDRLDRNVCKIKKWHFWMNHLKKSVRYGTLIVSRYNHRNYFLTNRIISPTGFGTPSHCEQQV